MSPKTWFAGKSYPVTITGTGFTTSANATASCPVTPVAAKVASGSSTSLTNVTVVSPTQITFTVEPGASDPTGNAAITVGSSSNGGAVSVRTQILGNQIQWNGKTISTADGSAPPAQDAVVGEQIALTTPALPSGITAISNTWTAGAKGTNIGGVVKGALSSNGSPTKLSVTPTVLTASNLTTYWLYPNPSVPVTYQYCVNIQGANPILQCSLPANATFNVTGPTATVAPVLTNPDATDAWSITDQTTTCSMQFLKFGLATGIATGDASCPGDTVMAGIAFQATVDDDAGGSFFWQQLLISDVVSATEPGTTLKPASAGPGLDNNQKYSAVSLSGLEAYDAPSQGLDNVYTAESDAFSANMYLMWQSNADSSYIPVPVGYVNWSIIGNAQNLGGAPPWSLTPCGVVAPCPGASATAYASSDLTGPAPGMPTWTTIITNTAGYTNLALQSDEEQEQ
jgi:hypothetical protein